MRIEGPGKNTPVRGASKADKKKKADSAGFGGMVSTPADANPDTPVSGVTSIAQIDALLTLQNADDSTSDEAEARAKKRGALLLEHLEHIRMGILMGGIPRQNLTEMAHLAEIHRDAVMDPHLRDVLDEIDLRVQVELAKHDRK